MVDNWEFSLSHVKGKYLLFLGDDDGLLSQALEKCHDVLSKKDSEVLFFDWVGYTWPDQIDNTIVPNKINFYFINESEKTFDYHLDLNDVIKARQNYHVMPTIYTSFVSKEIIQKTIVKNGKFFNSICPDIYSGILLNYTTKKIIKLNYYLGIRGASKYSNGVAFSNKKKENKHISSDFNDLNKKSKVEWNTNIPFIANNYAYVLEAYIQYRKEFNIPLSQLEFFLIFIRLIRRVYFDLSLDSQRMKQDLSTIQSTIQLTKLLNKVSKYILIKYISYLLSIKKREKAQIQSNIDSKLESDFGFINNQLIINGDELNINNILDVQVFLAKLFNRDVI